MTPAPRRIVRSKSSFATPDLHQLPPEGMDPLCSSAKPAAQRLTEALDALIPGSTSLGDQSATAKLAAALSPCYFHRRFDDAVDIGKVLADIAGDESMSHSRLVQTATGVREVSKQLQRRPIKRAVRNIMIVTKARDNRLVLLTRQLTEWLLSTPRYGAALGVNVYVDAKLRKSKRFDAPGLTAQDPRFERMLRYWTPDLCWTSPEKFDLVLTLGGDGTVLFTSWLFQQIVPPILSFALGSLGFLTPFDYESHRMHLNRVMGGVNQDSNPSSGREYISTQISSSDKSSVVPPISHSSSATGTSSPAFFTGVDNIADAGMLVNLRMRFTCTVYRAPPASRLRKGVHGPVAPATEACQFEVLNELVIDRGPSPYVSNLELFGDDELLTVIQADGIIFSTPTGSTAYSLSAGGSLVHPSIPAILLTPICPHTLSFRPMLLNDTMALRIAVPRGSRNNAWCSFDGKGRIELCQGDYVSIRASRYPFATVVGARETWIDSVSRTLRWNTREARQKGWNGGGRNKIDSAVGRHGGVGAGEADEMREVNEHDDNEERCDGGADEDGEDGNEEYDIDFDDDAMPGDSTPGDSGYGGDESTTQSPSVADERPDGVGSPPLRKLSLLTL